MICVRSSGSSNAERSATGAASSNQSGSAEWAGSGVWNSSPGSSRDSSGESGSASSGRRNSFAAVRYGSSSSASGVVPTGVRYWVAAARYGSSSSGARVGSTAATGSEAVGYSASYSSSSSTAGGWYAPDACTEESNSAKSASISSNDVRRTGAVGSWLTGCSGL